MIKRISLLIMVLSLGFSLCSCETIKGTGEGFFTGIAKDVGNTCDNIADLGRALKRADEEFEEKFW
ncbi:MAG: hypothetical protein KJ593_00010 [Candidatus Omnitrophica bacterium]|nr:hypothetical protein [Candidatus Omnitrophota bacterium]